MQLYLENRRVAQCASRGQISLRHLEVNVVLARELSTKQATKITQTVASMLLSPPPKSGLRRVVAESNLRQRTAGQDGGDSNRQHPFELIVA